MQDFYRNPAADRWFEDVTRDFSAFPFAFEYDGRTIQGFPPNRLTQTACEREAVDGDRVRVRAGWRVDDNLSVTLVALHDRRYGESEWTVYFENTGAEETGLISGARSEMRFEGRYPILTGIMGDHTNWYRPYALDVGDQTRYFESNSGRATHVCFPYFNLQYGDGGAMLAIGWAGTWRADFSYDKAENVTTARLRSVNNLRLRLKRGERVRTALFVRAAYTRRSEAFATNYWRQWFVDRNLPRADAAGTRLQPFSTSSLASDTGRPNSDGSISEGWDTWRRSLEKMLSEDVKVDFRWFDAGWYIAPDGTSPQTDWWGTVGTWTLDPNKWPGNTFRESTDFARAHSMKTLMWFEPERVTDPENLAAHYGYDTKWAIRYSDRPDGVISNNIGDPDCLRWTLQRITKTLVEGGVEMYREDNNSDQAALWRYMDAREGEDRQGVTECRFISAHYRMWDEIIACTLAHGGCGFVDSCASGGGRNDLESLRRGIPLLRSDYDRTSTGIRLSMTTAFNRWVPFCGAINKEKKGQLDPKGTLDMYVWRASYLAAMNVDSQYAEDPDQDWDTLRRGLKEWRRVSPYILKDMYVHTPWHTEEETTGFTAYSYFDPETREGVLLAFRQEACEEERLTLTFPFLKAEETCTMTDEDTGETLEAGGGAPFELAFAEKREARLLWLKVKAREV